MNHNSTSKSWILDGVFKRNHLEQQFPVFWNRRASFSCQNFSLLLWVALFFLNTSFEGRPTWSLTAASLLWLWNKFLCLMDHNSVYAIGKFHEKIWILRLTNNARTLRNWMIFAVAQKPMTASSPHRPSLKVTDLESIAFLISIHLVNRFFSLKKKKVSGLTIFWAARRSQTQSQYRVPAIREI